MEALANQVKAEMADHSADLAAVQRDIKKLERLSKDVSKRQQHIAIALRIEG